MYRALPYFIETFLFHALLAHRCLSYRLAPVRQLSPVYTFQPKHRPDGPLHVVLLEVLAKIRRSFVRQVAQPEKRLLQVVKLKRWFPVSAASGLICMILWNHAICKYIMIWFGICVNTQSLPRNIQTLF